MADTSWAEVVDAWEKRGAPRHVAEGIADAVRGESGFHSTIVNPTSGATALYQDLGERKAKLLSLKNWQDPEVQHDFAKSELEGGDRIATANKDKIFGAKTREEAKAAWNRYFERPGITSSDKPGGRFASSGIEFEQGRNNTSVRYMDPLDYLAMLPPIDDDAESGGKAKRRALMKSLNLGDQIEAIPTIELSGSGDKRKIADFDGRHRAQAAADADLTLIPVAFRGISPGNEPKEIVARNGEVHPFSWAEVPKMIGGVAQELFGIKSAAAGEPVGGVAPWLRQAGPAQSPPPANQPAAPVDQPLGDRAPWLKPAAPAPQEQPGFLSRELERAKEIVTAPAYFAAGAAQLPVGAAQFAAHSAEAAGVPGAGTVAGATDAAERGLEGFVQRGGGDAPYLAGAGNIAASAAVPVGRIAQLPALARPLAQAAVGAGIGAAEPVDVKPRTLESLITGEPGGDYWPQKVGQVEGGAATGGILGALGQALGAAGGLVNKIVTPADITRAAGRLFGAPEKKLTPDIINKQALRIGDTLETIERATTVPVGYVDRIALGRILADAATLLPQEFAPIRTVIESTLAKGPTVNGKEMADLMHKHTPLDRLTRHPDSNIAREARKIVSKLRDMMESPMPPATRDVYRAARNEWRDMEIVTDALTIGKTTLDPRRYANEVAARFPKEGRTPIAASPPVLELGRAAGELFTSAKGAQGLPTAAGLAAFTLAHTAGAGLGAAPAYMAAHGAGAMARNRLIDMAIARSPNALQAIQPQPRPFGNMLTGLGAPQIAPAGAAAATMP